MMVVVLLRCYQRRSTTYVGSVLRNLFFFLCNTLLALLFSLTGTLTFIRLQLRGIGGDYSVEIMAMVVVGGAGGGSQRDR